MYQPKKDITTVLTKAGCFEVTSHALHTNGYPVAYLPYYCPTGPKRIKKKQMVIYRYVWSQYNGPIPPGLHVMHTCDNRLCINPLHLKLGTHQDNMADKVAKGRHAKGDTCGRSKINSGIVIQILNDNTRTHTELGSAFGISRSQVSYIKGGQSWKHLQPQAQ